MKRETLIELNAARRAGRPVIRAVNLKSGAELLISVGDSSPLGAAATIAARSDQSGPLNFAGESWFLTVYNPPLDLAVVGAVHIAQPLSVMAQLAGYNVRIIDPRTSFATVERFPGITISHDWPDQALEKAPLGPRSALVALTHDPKLDDPALTAALRSDCFYVGALGSRKTQSGRRERLKQHGFSDSVLNRIHGPIGLAIGAKSPAEIAIAILAEMTQELRMGGARENASTRATANV